MKPKKQRRSGWVGAEKSPASASSGLEGESATNPRQDTPGRPKSASSRQQTQPVDKDATDEITREAEAQYSDK